MRVRDGDKVPIVRLVSDQNAPTPARRTALSSTAVVMGATMVSRLLGFARQAVVNAVFGASGSADVLNAVFNVPNNLRKLLAEGALSSAFIPVLSQSVADPAARASGVPRRLVRKLFSFQTMLLVPFLVLSVIFARPITTFILDFPEPDRQLLATQLFRYFIHYTLLISISAVMVGSLNSTNRFAVPAFTPIVFSVLVIASVVLLYRSLGVYSMAVGVLAGGIGQVLFQTPQFIASGFDFRPSFNFSDPTFRRVLRQWLPVVASSSVFVVNQQVAIYFASGLEDGSASALTNAVVFWQLPLGIFGVSVTTVLFPRMSREAVDGETLRLRSTVAYGVRAIIALLVPSALILGFLSFEIVSVAFQRGQFNEGNTLMAARVLIGYCLGMVGVGLFNFLQRACYARGDYRTPTLTALVVLAVDVAGSVVLKETSLRVAGLAVANSIAFSLGAATLLLRLRLALGGLETRPLAVTLGKVTLAAAVLTAGLVMFRRLFGTLWKSGSSMTNLGVLAAAGIVSVLLVGFAYWVLRVEVVTILRNRRSR